MGVCWSKIRKRRRSLRYTEKTDVYGCDVSHDVTCGNDVRIVDDVKQQTVLQEVESDAKLMGEHEEMKVCMIILRVA